MNNRVHFMELHHEREEISHLTNYNELYEFWEMAQALEPNNRYFEIGSRRGYSMWMMGHAVKGSPGEIIAIDYPGAHWGDDHSTPYLYKCAAALEDTGRRVHIIFGNSHDLDVQDIIEHRFGRLYHVDLYADVIFLDGDHSYSGVLADFNYYVHKFLRPGGLVGFHDIVEDKDPTIEVPAAWKKLQAQHPDWDATVIDHGVGLGIGVLRRPT